MTFLKRRIVKYSFWIIFFMLLSVIFSFVKVCAVLCFIVLVPVQVEIDRFPPPDILKGFIVGAMVTAASLQSKSNNSRWV